MRITTIGLVVGLILTAVGIVANMRYREGQARAPKNDTCFSFGPTTEVQNDGKIQIRYVDSDGYVVDHNGFRTKEKILPVKCP